MGPTKLHAMHSLSLIFPGRIIHYIYGMCFACALQLLCLDKCLGFNTTSTAFTLCALFTLCGLACVVRFVSRELPLVPPPTAPGVQWEYKACGCGFKPTPKWGIKPPPTPVLAIFDPWGGFMPPGGGFIPPFGGVGLSPHRGGFIPAKGWFYPPKGVVLSPHWVIWGGGGIAPLG